MEKPVIPVWSDYSSLNWAEAVLPDLARFEAIARDVYKTLPVALQDLCGDIQIRVDEYASNDMLEKLNNVTRQNCLGCFRRLTYHQENSAVTSTATERIVREIWVYRQPVLKRWIDHDEPLGLVIADVMAGEICHHMGLGSMTITHEKRMIC
jgi:predicted Zn-dependent protease with MMP-like domain